MFAIGIPILALAAPAAGVLFGWLLGGLVNVVMRSLPGRRHGQAVPPPTARLSGNRVHWERVYLGSSPQALSWFEGEPHASLAMIDSVGLAPEAPIVDVGGGTSLVVSELLERGHTDLTVLDISAEALATARANAPGSDRVKWVVGDVRTQDFGRRFALWHDRALFHFMVEPEDREAYLRTLSRSLLPGANIIIATFGPDAPAQCSGLPVERYSAEKLADAVADVAVLKSHRYEQQQTPRGEARQYLYAQLEPLR